MKYDISPIGDKIYVRLTREQKTSSGIILAADAQITKLIGYVLAVGQDVQYIKSGDNIIIDKFSGQVIEDIGSDVYTIIHENEVLGIVK